MKKLILFFILIICLFAKDSDFDGVEDKFDKCPNTPFLSLVDKNGCPVKKIHIKKYRYYLGKTNTYTRDKIYILYFAGFKFKYDNYIMESYYSKLKYNAKTDTYSKYIAFGYKYKKTIIKFKQYFKTNFNNNYLTLHLAYSDDISVIFEHKFYNAKYNNCLTLLKNVKFDKFKFGIYDYNYLNEDYNFIGGFVSYYFTDNFYFTTDYYKNTNKTDQKNITFMFNIKF